MTLGLLEQPRSPLGRAGGALDVLRGRMKELQRPEVG